MAKNKTLTFGIRIRDHQDECSICGRHKLGRQAIAAQFTPEDPPIYAAVYCFTCIKRMHLTMHRALLRKAIRVGTKVMTRQQRARAARRYAVGG